MSNKRVLMPDVYKQHQKKICATTTRSPVITGNNIEICGNQGFPTTAREALLLLRSIFPVEKFEHRLPAIILKHQVYSLITNKTLVDNELNELKLKGDIRCFHLGMEADDICIVFKEDFKHHVERANNGNAVVDKFMRTLFERTSDLSLSKDTLLKDFITKESDITEIMKAGLLTARDVGSWWLAIPRAGEFMKCYIRGRKATLLMIRKSKYSEILQQELETRKLPKVAKLGMLYHIHDIVGAELVTCINTTSGKLLRLKE